MIVVLSIEQSGDTAHLGAEFIAGPDERRTRERDVDEEHRFPAEETVPPRAPDERGNGMQGQTGRGIRRRPSRSATRPPNSRNPLEADSPDLG
jgi:hypothetical protein